MVSRFTSPTGITRSSKKPASQAATACWWLSKAIWSWSARDSFHSLAVISVCSPIDRPVVRLATLGIQSFRSLALSLVRCASFWPVVLAAWKPLSQSEKPMLAPTWTLLMLSTPPTRARSRPRPSIMPAASMTPIMLVEQAMIVEKAGMVGSAPASSSTSRAMLLQVRLGITVPQIAKSGRAPCASMAWTTGTDRAMASWSFSGPSTLAKGVRRPAASQMSGLDAMIVILWKA